MRLNGFLKTRLLIVFVLIPISECLTEILKLLNVLLTLKREPVILKSIDLIPAEDTVSSADSYQQYITEIMLTDQPSIMSQARVPSKPVSPNKPLDVIKGFLLGFVLACLVLAIRFFMDDKIKSGDDIRKYTDMNVLAIVPVNGILTLV